MKQKRLKLCWKLYGAPPALRPHSRNRLEIFELRQQQQQFPLKRNKNTSFKYQQILITVVFWDAYWRWIIFPLVVDFTIQTWSSVLVRPGPLHSAPNFKRKLEAKKKTTLCRVCSSVDSVSGCRLTFTEVLNAWRLFADCHSWTLFYVEG